MSWVKFAKPGDKVVCVDNDIQPPEGVTMLDQIERPVVGKIYTIDRIEMGEVVNEIGITFNEIPLNRVRIILNRQIWTAHVLYDPADFRPVQSRPTDISIFTAMLDKAPAREEVDA